jgi:O-antigen/teichoic acid export membrane protein
MKRLRPKSEFSRNVLTLVTGTSVAQIIPIAISPVLTRIYSPEDFGIYALFLSLVAIFGVMANGKYELAIILPKNNNDAYGLLVLAMFLTFISSIVLFLIFYVLNFEISNLLKSSEIGFWLYLIPLSIFLTSFFSVLVQYNNRIKSYKNIANANIVKSFVGASIQLSVGLIKASAGGLIAGQIGSSFVANYKLWTNVNSYRNLYHNKISFSHIVKLAKRYINFPKYTLPSSLLEAASSNLPVILFGSLFSMSIVGFLMLSQRIIRTPLSLVGGSIAMVFRQKASEDMMKNGNCQALYLKTLKKLLFLGFPPFLLLYFLAPFLFELVFGEEWREAGVYTQILTTVYYLQFISNPLSTMFYVAEKQRIDLYIQIFIILAMVSAMFIGRYTFNSVEISLYLFSAVFNVKYIIQLALSYRFSKGER